MFLDILQLLTEQYKAHKIRRLELICQGKILRLNLRKMICYTSLNLVTLCQEILWWENYFTFSSYSIRCTNFEKFYKGLPELSLQVLFS